MIDEFGNARFSAAVLDTMSILSRQLPRQLLQRLLHASRANGRSERCRKKQSKEGEVERVARKLVCGRPRIRARARARACGRSLAVWVPVWGARALARVLVSRAHARVPARTLHARAQYERACTVR
eukprot:6175749-Pleurochrysis_carterae.AAC.2